MSAKGLDRKAHPYALADAARVSKRGWFDLSLELVIVLSVTPPVGDVTGECGVLGESGAKASNKGREDARRAPAYSRWTPTPSRYVSAPRRAILVGDAPEHLRPFLFGLLGLSRPVLAAAFWFGDRLPSAEGWVPGGYRRFFGDWSHTPFTP